MDRLLNVTFAQWLWALIAVRTRTFKVEKARGAEPMEPSSGGARSFDALLAKDSTSCMVPYVDMMNHDFDYSARYCCSFCVL
jgi:hypothetical protein